MFFVGNNESEAIKGCTELSQKNPGKYVYANSTFGLFAQVEKRLSVYAPSDSVFNWYALNGQVKKFTSRQIIADQNATPTLY
tara:strand:+ start:538 stop:783 length:246 start_codon:yes stop_codon:yes gene_type:complete